MNAGRPANAAMLPRFNSMVTNAANAAVNTVGNAAGAVGNVFGNAAGAVSNVVGNAAGAVSNVAANAGNMFATSVKNIVPQSVASPIMESVKSVPSSETSLWTSIPIILGVGILIVLVVLVSVFYEQLKKYMEDAVKKIQDYFKAPSAPAVPTAPVPSEAAVIGEEIAQKVMPSRKQVFNVADNHYTYADAAPLCKALGAELATYDQVKEAWNKGADWCNYGWVKGQTAVYPTQKSTFDKLQNESTDDQRLACGQVGVNGGYFDNPDLRFGVNCYGEKPAESEHSAQRIMKGGNVPLTPSALDFDKKVAAYKAKSGQIAINPFNESSW